MQCHTLDDVIINDGNLNNPLLNYFELQLESVSQNLEIAEPSSLIVNIIDNDSKCHAFVMCYGN